MFSLMHSVCGGFAPPCVSLGKSKVKMSRFLFSVCLSILTLCFLLQPQAGEYEDPSASNALFPLAYHPDQKQRFQSGISGDSQCKCSCLACCPSVATMGFSPIVGPWDLLLAACFAISVQFVLNAS